MNSKVNPQFWSGKRVFLTGHTGFKGGWLAIWLKSMGANVKGFALQPDTDPNFFEMAGVSNGIESEIGDIRDLVKVKQSIVDFNPDVLIHMAAQALVRLSYKQPVETYSTNVMGTVNVLEAARACDNLRAIVNVTTDKCYENREWYWGYREDEAMGGYDPYSSSKGCAELITSAYQRSFFNGENKASLASVRAGNVIGGGDWSVDRLIPDIMRAIEKSEKVVIRNPLATRPWQHVLEPLSGYLMLAERLYSEGHEFAEGWNFGPEDLDVQNVQWIAKFLCELWGDGAGYTFNSVANLHEANYLKLDCSKAKQRLGWKPKWNIDTTLELIVEWNKTVMSGGNARDITEEQMKKYLRS